jgi:hypothetical protein
VEVDFIPIVGFVQYVCGARLTVADMQIVRRPAHLIISSAIAIALGGGSLPAQQKRPPDLALNPALNRQVVQGVLGAINRYYVSLEIAGRVEEVLGKRLEAGEYDAVTSAFELVHLLNQQLQDLSRDKHLYMAYSHDPQPLDPQPETDSAEEKADELLEAKRNNFGFEKVARLDGNIGYLEINSFVRPEWSGPAAAAAMSLLANTDALIVDLRESSGGSPEMVVFMASFFFDTEPVHLGDIYFRTPNSDRSHPGEIQQWWTYAYMPAARYVNKELYILTSKSTFSAAEGLPKRLQALKRAVVVGERTRGGNNPGLLVTVHPHFAVFVPTGKPFNNGDEHSNPEGGIQPDIELPAEQALAGAQYEALKHKLQKAPEEREKLQPVIDDLKKKLTELGKKTPESNSP